MATVKNLQHTVSNAKYSFVVVATLSALNLNTTDYNQFGDYLSMPLTAAQEYKASVSSRPRIKSLLDGLESSDSYKVTVRQYARSEEEMLKSFAGALINDSVDLDSEISSLVSEHFWDLV